MRGHIFTHNKEHTFYNSIIGIFPIHGTSDIYI